jgi:MoxR-like ATPase
MFYPVYITGLSGNGKTMMVEQACAKARREMVRVNITAETDEDDLIGGFRLVDGQTVWHNGPVVMAMERGAVLLLDEVDLGTIKLMCLQPVLEGKSVFIKKINKLVQPARGFTVIATANTKGRGSDDGRFIGTNVMNEAWLERFSITMEQEYPPAVTEKKILHNLLDRTEDDKTFVELLIKWADAIRRTYYDGGTTEIISTRRLVHICDAYKIFSRDRMKAIRLCLNRFDVDTKTSFMDLYTKIDAEANAPVVANTETSTATTDVSLEDKIKQANEIVF